MRLSFLPFLLLAIPVLEIAVFIMVGDVIGLWPTLGMILVTAFLGTLLLRHQGFQLLREAQAKTQANQMPGRALVHGVMLIVAGIFLLTPGFVTDSCGFLLFIPPVRDGIWAFLKSRMSFQVMTPGGPNQQAGNPFEPNAQSNNHPEQKQGPVIDLEETEFGPTDPKSPWNK
ncbi:MAG: FxsA family protein [Lentilitoribacter sp.]